jgi:hypothetical protein
LGFFTTIKTHRCFFHMHLHSTLADITALEAESFSQGLLHSQHKKHKSSTANLHAAEKTLNAPVAQDNFSLASRQCLELEDLNSACSDQLTIRSFILGRYFLVTMEGKQMRANLEEMQYGTRRT